MPTGYTSKIADPSFSFREFALDCARAIDYCATFMHEADSDKPIPEEFKPSDYTKDLAQSEKRLRELLAMTDEQAEAAAALAYEEETWRLDRMIEECRSLAARYAAMLAQVEAWEPPTEEHVGLKDFMRKQIEISAQSDCDVKYYEELRQNLKPRSGRAWRSREIASWARDVEYCETQHAKAVEQAAKSTAWIKALRESV